MGGGGEFWITVEVWGVILKSKVIQKYPLVIQENRCGGRGVRG